MGPINSKQAAAVALFVLALPFLGMAAARQALFVYGRERAERIAPHDTFPDEIQRVTRLTR